MERDTIATLSKRVEELERLVWSMFRAVETYATFNEEPAIEDRDQESGKIEL